MAERAAIVTGGSRGIGLALAEVLADEGCAVTVTARKPETLEQAANALRKRGGEVEQVAANLTDEESVSAVVAHHRETFGRLDVLVDNAGVGIGVAVDEHRTKYVDMQLGVPLRESLPGGDSLPARVHQAAKLDADVIVYRRSGQHDKSANRRSLVSSADVSSVYGRGALVPGALLGHARAPRRVHDAVR